MRFFSGTSDTTCITWITCITLIQVIQVIQLIKLMQVRLAHLWPDFRVIWLVPPKGSTYEKINLELFYMTFNIGKFLMVVALANLQMTTVLSYSSPRTWSWQSRYPFSDNREAFFISNQKSNLSIIVAELLLGYPFSILSFKASLLNQVNKDTYSGKNTFKI